MSDTKDRLQNEIMRLVRTMDDTITFEVQENSFDRFMVYHRDTNLSCVITHQVYFPLPMTVDDAMRLWKRNSPLADGLITLHEAKTGATWDVLPDKYKKMVEDSRVDFDKRMVHVVGDMVYSIKNHQARERMAQKVKSLSSYERELLYKIESSHFYEWDGLVSNSFELNRDAGQEEAAAIQKLQDMGFIERSDFATSQPVWAMRGKIHGLLQSLKEDYLSSESTDE